MKVLIVFACIVAVIVAHADHTCGNLERLKVKRQWAASYGHGIERAELGHYIWQHTFHHARKARDLFTKVRGDNIHSNMFKAHSERVLSSLDLCIALLDDVPTFEAAIEHLRVQHIERNVKAIYWTAFVHSVLRAIENEVGSMIFDKDSWEPCMLLITDGIRGVNLPKA